MYLIKGAQVFAPESLGIKDILLSGDKFICISDEVSFKGIGISSFKEIDAKGLKLIPGFIDGHQHFTGGGGEGGYTSKVPEMSVDMNIENGVTSAIGLLGTDSISRSVENLFSKTKAFEEEGITTRMLTGSYWHPSPTITGNIGRDIALIDPVIGLKLAISDHRGPYLETKDIAKLAAEVKLSAMISGKAGFITLHVGGLNTKLTQVIDLIKNKQFASSLFVPTHINRKSLLDEVRELAYLKTSVDATAISHLVDKDTDKLNAAELIDISKKEGWLDYLCISSDAGGSLPIWNEDKTKMIGVGVGTPESLLFELKLAVSNGISLSDALLPFTVNPARQYQFKNKGMIKEGYDADFILIDDELAIHTVFAKGRKLFTKE